MALFFLFKCQGWFFFTGLPNGVCGREKKSSWIIIRNDIRYWREVRLEYFHVLFVKVWYFRQFCAKKKPQLASDCVCLSAVRWTRCLRGICYFAGQFYFLYHFQFFWSTCPILSLFLTDSAINWLPSFFFIWSAYKILNGVRVYKLRLICIFDYEV